MWGKPQKAKGIPFSGSADTDPEKNLSEKIKERKMKNKAKQFKGIALSLAAMMSVGIFAGCGRTKIVEDSSGKSILKVYNYAGGFGQEWMAAMEKAFEETYAETSFEEGKTGVDIQVTNKKDQATDIYNKVENLTEEVFFIEGVDYGKWTANKKMLDITDVATGSNSRDNNKTIVSKLSADETSYFGAGGTYYALPHHDHQVGLIYDVDLFEEEGLYFDKDGAPSEKNYAGTEKYTSGDNRSAGPDGEYGTSDDGLPATYEDFYALCDHMATGKGFTKTIVPILWSGKNRNDYLDWFLSELTADFEGAEQLRLNYTFNGTAKNLVSVAEDGTITHLDEATITPETGYLVYQSEGRYQALSFLDKIVDTASWYKTNQNFGTLEHTEAQYNYLLGATDLSTTRYAFLVDGCWWENEAADSFASIVDTQGEKYSRQNRKFAFMPLPKATADKVGEEFTIATTDVTVAFIKSNIASSKIDLAKTFLSFVYEDEQLKTFNTVSGLPASASYTLSDEEYNALSSFSKSLYDVKDQNVSPYSTTALYKNHYEALKLPSTFTAGGKHAVDALKGATTAASYYNSLVKNKSASAWKESYQSDF